MTTIETYTPGQFCWVDLNAKDFDAMAKWYAELWGWTLETDPTPMGRYGIFSKDGQPVAGMGEMSDEMKAGGMPSVWNSYVCVEDCRATVAKAKELGGEILFDTHETPNESGTLAFLKDPEGAVFALWQPGNHIGARRVNEPGSFSWNELAVRDIAKAKAFYGELFGWQATDMESGPAKVTMFENAGRPNGHALQMTEEWEGMPPHWSVYFAVADTDATVKQIEALGGKVHVPPFDIPQGRIAVVANPDGATNYLIKLAQPAD
ncbi:MAG: VOC family protein [Polyangiaceae bacterium]